jgi:hypothetical protein
VNILIEQEGLSGSSMMDERCDGENGAVLRVSHWRASFFVSRSAMVLPQQLHDVMEKMEWR